MDGVTRIECMKKMDDLRVRGRAGEGRGWGEKRVFWSAKFLFTI